MFAHAGGKEFATRKKVAEAASFFFARPRRRRGLNERANGTVRPRFPKMADVRKTGLAEVENLRGLAVAALAGLRPENYGTASRSRRGRLDAALPTNRRAKGGPQKSGAREGDARRGDSSVGNDGSRKGPVALAGLLRRKRLSLQELDQDGDEPDGDRAGAEGGGDAEDFAPDFDGPRL